MLNQIEKSYFRYQGSLRSNLLALLYCQLAYFGGFALILSLNPVLMVIGTLFLSHGMVIASYLIHDCAHNALFILPRYNALVGSVLNWLAGGCYGRFEDVRKQHMIHHVDKADVIEFDYRDYLVRHPIQRRTVEILEWLYVPAVEFIMHSMLIFAPFIFDDKKKPTAAHNRNNHYTLQCITGVIYLFSHRFCLLSIRHHHTFNNITFYGCASA